jgi:hypothetical protein
MQIVSQNAKKTKKFKLKLNYFSWENIERMDRKICIFNMFKFRIHVGHRYPT